MYVRSGSGSGGRHRDEDDEDEDARCPVEAFQEAEEFGLGVKGGFVDREVCGRGEGPDDGDGSNDSIDGVGGPYDERSGWHSEEDDIGDVSGGRGGGERC